MKISVYLKDPDGFSEGVEESVEHTLKGYDLPKDEMEGLKETREEKAWISLRRWVEDNEYVGIEFDTETGLATVKERK